MAYNALFGSPPDGIAASGYDAMRLLALAIETAGARLTALQFALRSLQSVVTKVQQPFRITMRTDTPSKVSQFKLFVMDRLNTTKLWNRSTRGYNAGNITNAPEGFPN